MTGEMEPTTEMQIKAEIFACSHLALQNVFTVEKMLKSMQKVKKYSFSEINLCKITYL